MSWVSRAPKSPENAVSSITADLSMYKYNQNTNIVSILVCDIFQGHSLFFTVKKHSLLPLP